VPRRTSSFVARSVLALVALALVLSVRPAFAEPTEAEIEAKAAMKRGIAAFAKRDAETALAEYRTAERLVPDANLPHRYAAEALVELERYEEAIQEYETYLRIKPDVSDAAEVKQRMEKARAKLDGTLDVRSSPPGASVYLDGAVAPAGTTPLTGLKVRRGSHVLVLRLTDRKEVTLSPTVRGGETLSLSANFADAPAPSTPRDSRSTEPSNPSKTLGWVALGVGGAVLATAFVIDAFVLPSTFDKLDDKRSRDDPSAGSTLSQARHLQTISIVGYVAGGVVTATGLVLVLWPRKSSMKASVGVASAALSLDF
jgi:tetratricopeptide (TPR) repeat protein